MLMTNRLVTARMLVTNRLVTSFGYAPGISRLVTSTMNFRASDQPVGHWADLFVLMTYRGVYPGG